jgi:hypothetical protein
MQGIGRLFLAKEIVIEHRHWLNGRRKLDENYRWVYGKEEQEYGAKALQEYLYNYFQDDIIKLRTAMLAENK